MCFEAGLAIPRDQSLSAIPPFAVWRQRLCSAYYEIVWFQLLGLVIGSSAISLAVLLGTSWVACAWDALPCRALFRRTPSPTRLRTDRTYDRVIGVAVLWGMPLSTRYTLPSPGAALSDRFAGGYQCGLFVASNHADGRDPAAIARWIKSTQTAFSVTTAAIPAPMLRPV